MSSSPLRFGRGPQNGLVSSIGRMRMVMVVVMSLVPVCSRLHLTVQPIHRAIPLLVGVTLELNGGVTDPVLLAQHRFQCLQNGGTLTGRLVIDERVTGEGTHAAGNAPDVQIMHILYPRDTLHIIH